MLPTKTIDHPVKLGMPPKAFLDGLLAKIDLDHHKEPETKKVQKTLDLDAIFVEDKTMDPDFVEFSR